jgi:hypothetical protein
MAVAALTACGPLTPLTCGSAPDVGQFGPYVGPFKVIRLPAGDTLTVYRVKFWTFTDGSAPALQLEYQTRVSIADTTAVRAEQRGVWTVFKMYIDQSGVTRAIITATDRQFRGGSMGHLTRMRHFGSVAMRDSTGTWRFRSDPEPLPSGVDVGGSAGKGVGIFERSGAPLAPPPRA